MAETKGYWKGKRVLVTGGAGFLGSVVTRNLQEKGAAEVIVPRSKECDLREKESIVQLYRMSRPDMVIHLAAAVGGIGANRSNPGRFFYDNAIMGIQLLECARQFEINKYVCVGTICAYPKHAPVPFQEDELWNGYPEETNAPYGLAKKMLLVQAQAYRQQYGYNAIYLLPVNLYGPGDNFDLESSHVIPAVIRKCVEAKRAGQTEIQCWGSGNVSREFLYVEDAAEAIGLAAEHYDKADPVNIGTGEEIKIRDLVGMISELVGYQGKFQWDPSMPDGQPRRQLDTRRAYKEFSFRAQTKLRDGLEKTISWYESTLGKG